MSRAEAIKGISNRFVFSTFYIYLYLAMAGLSSVSPPFLDLAYLTRNIS